MDLGLPVILLIVMIGAFAAIDRYAARHPYGTGRFGEAERKRRAREAQLQGSEQRGRQARESNEAAIADVRARLRPETAKKEESGPNAPTKAE